jgi:hypothetical protein
MLLHMTIDYMFFANMTHNFLFLGHILVPTLNIGRELPAHLA